jgi:hypothetical protein
VPCCQRHLKAFLQENVQRDLNQRANTIVDQAGEDA